MAGDTGAGDTSLGDTVVGDIGLGDGNLWAPTPFSLELAGSAA